MKPRKFSRSKQTWSDEAAALIDVCEKMQLMPSNLTPAHTEMQFVWNTESQEGFAVKGYLKSDFDEKTATEMAMKDLGEVTEGNLKPDHTETHYVFTKVRG